METLAVYQDLKMVKKKRFQSNIEQIKRCRMKGFDNIPCDIPLIVY